MPDMSNPYDELGPLTLPDDLKVTTDECPECEGRGGTWDMGCPYPCPACNGMGIKDLGLAP